MTAPAERERVEAMARHLCQEAGLNPHQRLREWRRSWEYWRWEEFVPEARKMLGLPKL